MKFIIFVIDDLTNSGTPVEIVAIYSFNYGLRANGQWIFAVGLSAPSNSNVIDNRGDAGIETGKPLFDHKENFSGFWLIEAANAYIAKELALAGSKACNRRVELRPLL